MKIDHKVNPVRIVSGIIEALPTLNSFNVPHNYEELTKLEELIKQVSVTPMDQGQLNRWLTERVHEIFNVRICR